MPLLIRVDANSGVPVFRQIVDQIRLHIASGVLEGGEELPSTRAMSQELGVNPMTVSKAFVLLEQDGLVERRPGLPLIVRAQRKDSERERIDLLNEALERAVVVARLLGISPSKAATQFREMLNRQDTSNTEADE